ncbi:hypothetical protein ABIA35_000796 [Catenulispora sp. MAP12-49]|uniref:hypothetical protein n=1 Tax=Catenulispora sp. MAP12-49 TaxID=3156302 RepID=UPI0035184E1E
MNDMRELLSGALPAPQDEPQQRDVIDAAMDWGMRRRRRDWALSGAAALAVLAVGTGVAAMSGGSGNGASPAGGPGTSAATTASSSPSFPDGMWWTPYCNTPGTVKGDLAQYCKLYNEQQDFNVDFAKGSVKYIQAALPAGYTVKATNTWVLVLTGPNGKTNLMFPSAEPASTLDGNPLSCGTPAPPTCVQTSTAGGNVVVNNYPSGAPSAGYVGKGLTDPRVDLLLGTSTGGAPNGMAPPTSATPLLSNAQLAKILSDAGFLGYAKAQVQHLEDITKQLQNMAPPNSSGYTLPSPSLPAGAFPVGAPPTGASGSWNWANTPPSGSQSSGNSQPPESQSSGNSQPGGGQSSGNSQPPGSQSSGNSQPPGTGSSQPSGSQSSS